MNPRPTSPTAKPAGLTIETKIERSSLGTHPRSFGSANPNLDKWGHSLTLLPADQQQILETRRCEQVTEPWQRRYHIRAGVEATISQTVRRTGIRHTRYTGVDKTHLGHLFATAAVNIVRVDAWLTSTPLDRTRTSHLARLELAT